MIVSIEIKPGRKYLQCIKKIESDVGPKLFSICIPVIRGSKCEIRAHYFSIRQLDPLHCLAGREGSYTF